MKSYESYVRKNHSYLRVSCFACFTLWLFLVRMPHSLATCTYSQGLILLAFYINHVSLHALPIELDNNATV